MKSKAIRDWILFVGMERNGSLTQTMRLLERSFQGLRKAYNPVYRARKSRDIHSLVFALPLTSLTLDHPSHRETLPLIPFHFTITFYGPSTSIASIHAGFGNGNQPRKG